MNKLYKAIKIVFSEKGLIIISISHITEYIYTIKVKSKPKIYLYIKYNTKLYIS